MVIEVPEGGDLAPVAAAVCADLRPGDIVELRGPIGAGKTTLVQACARELSVVEPVTSPTFALAHRYAGRVPVAHLDLYRLEGAPAREPGDLLDYLGDDAVAFIEWPELGRAWLPAASLTVEIAVDGSAGRTFSITRRGS